MFDINDHPQQEVLNKEFGRILADTLRSIDHLSGNYRVDNRAAIIQYLDSFVAYVNRYRGIDSKKIKHEVQKALFIHGLAYKIKSFFGIEE